MKKLMSYLKAILKNGGFFVLVGIITYHYVFSQNDFSNIRAIGATIDKRYILAGLFAVFFMLSAESLTIKRNLRLLNEEKSFVQCMFYTFVGNFFSGITPAATGGQPMEIYFMHKNDIKVSKGVLALLMDLGAYQIAIVSVSLFGYIAYFDYINNALGKYLPVLLVGVFLNLVILTFTFTAIFSQKFIYNIVRFIAKIIAKFNKEKSELFKQKAYKGILQYKASTEILKKHKGAYFVNVIITVLRIIAMHSIPFWVYKSFGFTQVPFIQILSLQASLYVAGAALPFPGGVGISESAFLIFFKNVFPASLLEYAMILSRVIGFYSIIIFCGFAIGAIYMIMLLANKNKRGDVS